MQKLLRVAVLCALLGGISGCHPYKKQIPTGEPKRIQNAYSSPKYDHTHLLNVLVLPVDNPMRLNAVEMQEKEILLSVVRNMGKFNYFNLQTLDEDQLAPGTIIDLEAGEVNRLKLGELGKDHNAQAVLKVSVQDYQTFAPLRIKIKAALVDSQTGERIWAIDEVFDSQDAEVINGMRIWWNTRISAGGSNTNYDFLANHISPGFFLNYVLYEVAQSYSEMRIANMKAVAQEREKLMQEQARVEEMRQQVER